MISVIIPTYNRSNMLARALRSISEQSYKDIEIIIIDDCSTDDTQDIIYKSELISKIKYIKNTENLGPGLNRNKGFKLANGEYIIFLDDDDYYTNDRYFEDAVNILEKYNELAFVAANAIIEKTKTQEIVQPKIGFTGYKNGIDFLLNMNKKYKKPLSTFSSVFVRDVLERADVSNMTMVNDVAIYMRALIYGDVYVIEYNVGVYYMHDTNISTRITTDFLIENLRERLWIFQRLSVEKKVAENWLSNQSTVSFDYFTKRGNPKIKEIMTVLKWIIKNNRFNFKLYGRLSKLFLKNVILKK